jgi:hypothetical protein
MTNAFYITDMLPLKQDDTPTTSFESAILDYFGFYGPSRTRDLVSRLQKYDFASVKAEFIASVPGKFEGENLNKWGLSRLRKLLKGIASNANTELFAQVHPSISHLIAVFLHWLIWQERYLARPAFS